MATDFDAFIDTAWNDHGDDAAGVAARLDASTHLIAEATQVAPYARLVVHVYGEHLARYADGVALLARLGALPAAQPSVDATTALVRGTAVLRWCGGDAAAVDPLSPDERIAALATASSALGGQGRIADAIAAYDLALAQAANGVADGSPAVRALAVGGNNLAAALEEKPDRDARETRAMLAAAQAGLRYWRRAGGWLEEQRAEYMLSAARRAAGEYDGAIVHAERCLAICREHDAPALEQFFGLGALALAQRSAGLADEFERTRAQARDQHARVDASEGEYCAALLAQLDAD